MNVEPVSVFPVGDLYRVTVRVDMRPGKPVALKFEWDPVMPTKMSPHEMDDYRRGRDAAVAKFALVPIAGND